MIPEIWEQEGYCRISFAAAPFSLRFMLFTVMRFVTHRNCISCSFVQDNAFGQTFSGKELCYAGTGYY